MAGSEHRPKDGPMNPLRAFGPFVERHHRFAGLAIIVLPFLLAACTNATGGGSGY